MRVFQDQGALRRGVTKAETKVCPLCSALNFHANSACIACSWHGAFEQDAAAKDYQWQRLVERYEEVRLEHVTRSQSRDLDDFGIARRKGPWQRLRAAWLRLVSDFSRPAPRALLRSNPQPIGKNKIHPVN